MLSQVSQFQMCITKDAFHSARHPSKPGYSEFWAISFTHCQHSVGEFYAVNYWENYFSPKINYWYCKSAKINYCNNLLAIIFHSIIYWRPLCVTPVFCLKRKFCSISLPKIDCAILNCSSLQSMESIAGFCNFQFLIAQRAILAILARYMCILQVRPVETMPLLSPLTCT